MKYYVAPIAVFLLLLTVLAGCKEKIASHSQTSSIKNNVSAVASLPDTAGWTHEVFQQVLLEEYRVAFSKSLQEYASYNQQQNLLATYSGSLMTLTPASDSIKSWQLQLKLHGIYNGSGLQYDASGASRATVSAGQVDFDHQGAFTVNYANTPEGVRQNFIVHKKPAGKGKLSVRLSVNEGWEVKKANDGELHFMHQQPGGEWRKEITYNSLKVWDAENKELEARFSVSENEDHFMVEVNADDAVYPVTIDPLSTTADWTVSGDANDEFGLYVSTAGDVNGDGYSDVIVGAPNYRVDPSSYFQNGRLYVYYGSATGLSATPGSIFTEERLDLGFGNSIACAGDVNGDGYSDVVVGVHGWGNTADYEGGAFVFYGSASGLRPLPDIVESGYMYNYLGLSVASAGDVNGDNYSDIIVASGFSTAGGLLSATGTVHVYYGSDTGIAKTPSFKVDGTVARLHLGISVSAAGDINGDGYGDIIVGARGYNDEVSGGAAFIYYGSQNGLTEANKTLLGGHSPHSGFGSSVAGVGDINGDGYSDALIGAPFSSGIADSAGTVYLYLGSASGIQTDYEWVYESHAPFALLGREVAMAGDVNGDGFADALVSEHKDTAWLFKGSINGFRNEPDWMGRNAHRMASAGDVNGDGYSDIVAGKYTEGMVRGYYGSPDELTYSANTTIVHNQELADLGRSLSSAGDINGDGFDDVVVGVPGYNNGQFSGGAIFIYYGSPTGIPGSPSLIIESNIQDIRFGSHVAGAGDVDGDGYADVIASAPRYSLTSPDQGAVYLYRGGPGGLETTPVWMVTGITNEELGWVVAGVGDLNADGYADVGVSSEKGNGFVHIYYGSAAGPSTSYDWKFEGWTAVRKMGYSLSGAGDLNGDGYSDLVIGAKYLEGAPDNLPQVFVFYGSRDGLSDTPDRELINLDKEYVMGESVARAGDINGDGYGDLIIGASKFTGGGLIAVYYGSPTGIPENPATLILNDDVSYGAVLASAGDINGDGYSDVIVGAPLSWFPVFHGGTAMVYLGGKNGLSAQYSWSVAGYSVELKFGCAVDGAGDVNGDGFSDIIIGAYGHSLNAFAQGAAMVYLGNAGGGLRNNLEIYNEDLTTPINHNNIGQSTFGAGLFAKSPMGRGQARLVWEAVPKGTAFTGPNSTVYTGKHTAFTDLGTLGQELKALVGKASKETKLRVRVEYHKSTAVNGQVYGPWRYPSGYLQGAHSMSATPLPVQLERFTATYQQSGDVLLQWRTSMEQNSHSFEIQRSIDGSHFTTIGRITAAGIAMNYNYTDKDVSSTGSRKLYYRLRMTDTDQSATLSKVAMVELPAPASFFIRNVYPNPADAYINITIESAQADNVLITVIDMTGRPVTQQQVTITPGTQTVNINTSHLAAGMYVLRAQTKASRSVAETRFIKK